MKHNRPIKAKRPASLAANPDEARTDEILVSCDSSIPENTKNWKSLEKAALLVLEDIRISRALEALNNGTMFEGEK